MERLVDGGYPQIDVGPVGLQFWVDVLGIGLGHRDKLLRNCSFINDNTRARVVQRFRFFLRRHGFGFGKSIGVKRVG